MSDTNGDTPAEASPAPSRIVISFPNGKGSAGITVALENVEAAQTFAAAWYLDRLADDVLTNVKLSQAQGISPAGPNDLAALLRSMTGGRQS